MPSLALLLIASMTPGAPIADFPSLGRAVAACIQAPEQTAGSRLTIRLSLRRDGTVFGVPRITFSKLVGRPEDREDLIKAATDGIKACAPFPLTPGFGRAIAGRPFTLGIVATRKAVQT